MSMLNDNFIEKKTIDLPYIHIDLNAEETRTRNVRNRFFIKSIYLKYAQPESGYSENPDFNKKTAHATTGKDKYVNSMSYMNLRNLVSKNDLSKYAFYENIEPTWDGAVNISSLDQNCRPHNVNDEFLSQGIPKFIEELNINGQWIIKSRDGSYTANIEKFTLFGFSEEFIGRTMIGLINPDPKVVEEECNKIIKEIKDTLISRAKENYDVVKNTKFSINWTRNSKDNTVFKRSEITPEQWYGVTWFART